MSWSRVRGHENLVSDFQRVVRRGRLGHAYLFVGPEGVGKKQFATELAKAILCEAPEAAERVQACDQCPACAQIEVGTHPDFQSVGLPEDKHEFPIEIMQDLIGHLALKPARGKHRVAIIDDVDDLNEEAANCFLKTLEEPPPRSLLILIGTSPDRQFATIVSRCQVIRFPGLPVEIVADRLVSDGVVSNLADARRLAEQAGGSLGDARLLADPAVAKFRRELFDGLSQPRVNSVALAEKAVRFSEDAGKESAAKRDRGRLAIQFLIGLLRAALHVQSGQRPAFDDPKDLQAASRLAERLPDDRLLDALERCLQANYQVDRRLQLVLVLEAVIDALGQSLQKSGSH
jgi:DNA polymerase III subunit delta'